MARESASFIRHPPLKVVTGSAIIFLEKPTFSIISATSSLVEPQAWMRLRAERRVNVVDARRSSRGRGDGVSATCHVTATPSPRRRHP